MMDIVTNDDPHCQVVFGGANFDGHKKRGWKPAPTKAFRTFLVQHHANMLIMDEYLTSQVPHFPSAIPNHCFRLISKPGSV